MKKIREEKITAVKEIKEKFEKSKVVILTDYKGLTMSQLTSLRKKLRPLDAEYTVYKNTLINIATKDKSLDGFNSLLSGSTAILFGYNDQAAPAKILAKFIVDNEKPVIKGGLLDGLVIDQKMISTLAKLPSREVLLSKVIGGMQAPIYNFVSTTQGILRKFVYAVKAVKDKKASENKS
jgi:large subunit ribosomal protein L10